MAAEDKVNSLTLIGAAPIANALAAQRKLQISTFNRNHDLGEREPHDAHEQWHGDRVQPAVSCEHRRSCAHRLARLVDS